MKHVLVVLWLVCNHASAASFPFSYWKTKNDTAAVPVTNAPIHSFRFEEASGVRADSVGSATLDEYGGTISSVTGLLGNGFVIHTNSRALRSTNITLGGTSSLCYWMMSGTNSSPVPIAGYTGGSQTYLHQLIYPTSVHRIGNASAFNDSAITNFTTNVWHFFAIRITGSTVSRRMDAQPWVSFTVGGSFGATELYVGTWQGQALKLDALQIFDYYIPDSYADFIYNSGTGREYYSGAWTP